MHSAIDLQSVLVQRGNADMCRHSGQCMCFDAGFAVPVVMP